VLLQSLCKNSQTCHENLLKAPQNWGKVNTRLKWLLPCPIHINFGCFVKVLWKFCKIFGKSHEKSQELNYVLAPIGEKDWGQKFLFIIDLGVLEGLINRGFVWFSIFTPSSVQMCKCPGWGVSPWMCPISEAAPPAREQGDQVPILRPFYNPSYIKTPRLGGCDGLEERITSR